MAGKKKITKKKLKEPDEFINFTEQVYFFITHHLRKLVTGGIVLLVVLLSIFLFQKWERNQEEEANQKFSLAVQNYQMVSSPYREGSQLEYKNLLQKFDEVIAGYPRTSSGKLSFLYEGNIYLRSGQFEEAVKGYNTFLQKSGKEKLYRSFALEGLGYAYEGKKDYEKALDAYKKTLETGENFQRADADLGMGRCYEKLGKNKEALENYKAFLKVSQKSPMANAIMRKISDLEK